MTMKVYGLPMSTNVARVLVCLEEAGAKYEVVPIDFSTAEHKSLEHTSRNVRYNPFGQVPALQDGDMILFEVESHQFNIPMAVIIYQCLILPVYFGGETDVKVVEENLEKLNKTFEVYEERLSKFKYLAGDFLSLADQSHFPSAYYLLATPHATILDEFPLVKAWVTDMLARPAVKKVR
uniref:glutathione transferase n=1 Tax=Leersia perrieri TaxID=77586 RepID=A0A0D9V141_9ORYZ